MNDLVQVAENLDAKIEEILRKQEEINQEIERLNNLIKNKSEEDKTHIGWEPGKNEYYYFVDIDGSIFRPCNDSTFDENTIEHTRVFKTKEEAEFEAERMKVLRELEKFACEFKHNERDWYIYYDYVLQRISMGSSGFKCHELYFESEERVKEAIEAVGEDRVKKYYLEVKDN